jgi:hypothetical protein
MIAERTRNVLSIALIVLLAVGMVVQSVPTAAAVDPVGIVTDFENGTVTDNWHGDTDNASFDSSTAQSGSQSVNITHYNEQGIYSDPANESLPRYPQRGDSWTYYVRHPTGTYQNEPDSPFEWAREGQKWYEINVREGEDEILIAKHNASGFDVIDRTSFSPPEGEWLRVEVSHDLDGTITATVYDSTGSQLATVSGVDTTFTDGRIRLQEGNGGNVWFDNITITNTNTTHGTVTDADGNAITDATVEAVNTSNGTTEHTTTTDSTGSYRLSLSPGEYYVTASADGYENSTKTVDVPAGGTTVDFTLGSRTTITDPDPSDGSTVSEPPVELSVLADSTNESVQYITVEFYQKEDGSSDTQIGSSTVSPGDRAAVMWDPPPGTYEWYAVGTADSGARDTGGPYSLGMGEADIIDGSEQPPDGAVVDPVENVELAVDVRVDDDATVEFYDYETGNPNNDPLIGSQSVSSGTSTASTTWQSENRSASEEWYVILKDSTGTRDTAGAFAFGAGGVVVARDAETGNVIDDRTTRFDTVYPGGSQTFDRVPANLSLSEVNSEPGESIRIDVRAQDYYERTIEVSGKQADADVYLERGANWSYNPSSDNPDDTASVDDDPDRFISRFRLEDQTGRYPPSDTKLTVRADIDDDGQTDLVHSSTFGAANRVDVRVKRDRRYQLIVENGDGDSRGLGGWTATEPETTTLTISRVTEDIEIDQGYGVDAEISGTLKIYYRDYETRAETLDLEVREYPDGSYLENRTLTDVTNATVTIALNESQANKIWQIDYNGSRVGVEAANISGQVTTSPSGRVPLPVGSDVLIAGALIILAIVGALFTGPLSAVGSVAMVGVAGVLYFIGWLPINAVALWVAGIVAVGSVLRSGGGRLG